MSDRDKRILVYGLLALLVIGTIWGQWAYGPRRVRAKETKEGTKWEYKTVEIAPYKSDSEELSITQARVSKLQGYRTEDEGRNLLFLHASDLNALGERGWELVSAVPEVETVYPGKVNTRTSKITLLFKRHAGEWPAEE